MTRQYQRSNLKNRCWQDSESDLGQKITMVGRTIKRLLEKAIIREGEMNNFKEFFI